MVNIYRASKRIIALVYTTQAEELAAQRVTLPVTIYRQKPFCFFFRLAVGE